MNNNKERQSLWELLLLIAVFTSPLWLELLFNNWN